VDTVNELAETSSSVVSMREAARAAFRLAAAVAPPPPADPSPHRTLADPRHLARAGLQAARYGAELLECLWKGPRAGLGYLELDNKVRAFHFFETVADALELGSGALVPGEAIRRAESRLGIERAVWAIEGIGYELSERRRRAGQPPDGLLRAADADVPSGSWAVLHTGMGMSLAESSLERVGSTPSPELRRVLDEHVALCSAAARPGYAELAFEPLGLVARQLHPSLVPAVAADLAERGGPWSDLFWHGVGRGVYFLPANLPPARSSPWRGLDSCRSEPPQERSRQNAVAGFSWAVTLVNLGRPSVVEGFLAHHATANDPRDPVAQGVASALELWHEVTGGSKELRGFVRHVAAPDLRALWQQVVGSGFEEILRRASTNGTGNGRLPELFRYR
jgi:hypothetical protein